MRQCWLAVGREQNWRVAFESKNIWGLKDFREVKSLWNMLREGDSLAIYVSKPVHGIVGFGNIVAKFKQTTPLWPQEIKKNEVIWPLRFEFNIEYCLPPSAWKEKKYSSPDIQGVSRMIFQCFSIEEENKARIALGLRLFSEERQIISGKIKASDTEELPSHDDVKQFLTEIGTIQGYVADEEYPINSTRLDVVWRRVERSVPTYVFEVQVGGDIYHAMAKLKHAFDLWNSNIFLVASLQDKNKYLELISGTFHEVKDKMMFIEVSLIRELLEKKRNYKRMEKELGIFK